MTSWQTTILLILGVIAAGVPALAPIAGVAIPAWLAYVGTGAGIALNVLAGVFHPTTTVGVVNAQGQPTSAANNAPK